MVDNDHKQQNKWGYLNNPMWKDTRSMPESYNRNTYEEPIVWGNFRGARPMNEDDKSLPRTHFPCGHWHKPSVLHEEVIGANIFRVSDSWFLLGSAHSLYFDFSTETLHLRDVFYESPGVCGIEAIDLGYGNEKIVAVKGWTLTDHSLVTLDKGLNKLSEHDVFLPYDVTSPRSYMLANDGDSRLVFYNKGSGGSGVPDNERLVVMSLPDYGIVHRMHPGTVTTGTDGNLYGLRGYYDFGDAYVKPITGSDWTLNWMLIPDNIHTHNIINYVDWLSYVRPSKGVTTSMQFYENSLYMAFNAIVNRSYLRRYNKTNFDYMSQYYEGSMFHNILVNSFGVYAGGGAGFHKIARFNHSLNTKILQVSYPSIYGGGGTHPYGVCTLQDYIAVGTNTWSSYYGHILILDPITLDIVYDYDYLDHPSTISPQALVSLGPYLFIGENSGVSAFKLDSDGLHFLDYKICSELSYGQPNIGYKTKHIKILPERRIT